MPKYNSMLGPMEYLANRLSVCRDVMLIRELKIEHRARRKFRFLTYSSVMRMAVERCPRCNLGQSIRYKQYQR